MHVITQCYVDVPEESGRPFPGGKGEKSFIQRPKYYPITE